MRPIKFILGTAFITTVLCLVVLVSPLIEFVKHVFTEESPLPKMYSENQFIFGILAELIRAFFLCYLYSKFNIAGKGYRGAIIFGLITSGLIWTFWAIYAAGTFRIDNRIGYFIDESIIFFLQGFLSGAGLELLCKKKFI